MIDKGELLESRAVIHWIYTQSARGEPVVSKQSRFDTSRFDTNSSNDIAQNFRSLQVYNLRANMKNILGEYSSFSRPSTWNY